MKFLLIKLIFIIFIVIGSALLLSFNTPETLAATVSNGYYSNRAEADSSNSVGGVIIDCTDACNANPSCWNSESVNVTNCGTSCDGGSAWSKYDYYRCYQTDSSGESCKAAFVYDTNTCSTGDKYNSSNPPVLNAGFCNCSVGGGYKTCCSAGNTVSARSFNVDPYAPPEGDCGGAATVYCGGAGQPACGQAACATPPPAATPTPTPTPTPNPLCPGTGIPQSGWGGTCGPSGAQAKLACGACGSCSVASCMTYSNGALCWFNGGQCYNDPAACNTVNPCTGVCTPGRTQTICYPNDSTRSCNR